jgi:ferredoxin
MIKGWGSLLLGLMSRLKGKIVFMVQSKLSEYAIYFIAYKSRHTYAKSFSLIQSKCPMNTLETPLFFTAKIEPAGEQADVWRHQALLPSLEQGGIDWPSSCRNGTCRTCIGQLVSGEVRYEIEWPGLSTEEITEGCVLPCVAFPCSDVVLSACNL